MSHNFSMLSTYYPHSTIMESNLESRRFINESNRNCKKNRWLGTHRDPEGDPPHVTHHTALIADRDQFIAVAGGSKQLLNKAVSRQLEEKINNRETVIAAKGDRNYVNIAEDIAVDYAWQLIIPILCEGDIIGSVILLENDGKSKMGEVEQKLAQSAAGFLGRQMEQ